MRINAFLSTLVSLLVAGAAGLCPIGARADELKVAQQRQAASDITGAINPRGGAGAAPTETAVGHAQIARMRFAEARAAMDRGLLLHDAVPDADMGALQTNMKVLFDELSAIERAQQSTARDSAKQARDRVNDWYQAGLKIVAPPASGITELPAPTLMRQRANEAATALDLLVADASPGGPALSSTALPKMVPVARKPAAMQGPKPISQNEASLRLMRESLPLFLPIAGNVIDSLRRKDAGGGQANSAGR